MNKSTPCLLIVDEQSGDVFEIQPLRGQSTQVDGRLAPVGMLDNEAVYSSTAFIGWEQLRALLFASETE